MFKLKSFTLSRKKSSSVGGGGGGGNSLSEEKVQVKIGSFSVEGKAHPNEDRFFTVDDLCTLENIPPVTFVESIAFAGVYDGHGGGACSDFLGKCLHRYVATNESFTSFSDGATKALEQAFKDTEEEFTRIASASNETSGSCAIAALISGLDVAIAHCGDCRAVFRTDKSVKELTIDHRPQRPSEKARIMRMGGTIRGGRVQGVLAPSRSFGDLDVKMVAKDVVIATPDVIMHRVEVGKDGLAFLILASDGVWDAMSNEKATEIVKKTYMKTPDPERCARTLAEIASTLNADDITVTVVVWNVVSIPSSPKEEM